MGLSRTVSEINGDFSRKSQVPPVYFAPLLKVFPLELGTDARGQKLEWLGYGAEKEVWRFASSSFFEEFADLLDLVSSYSALVAVW